MLNLSDQERQEVQRCLDSNKPLPDRYRFLLFDNNRKAELIWEGKTDAVCDTVLPFQTTEIIGDSCGKDWSNKLIWGDNELILSSLKNGPMRQAIEAQGGLKLIYIDPPFDIGADFSMDIEVGEDTFTKKPNILEEIAYRDTWGKGADSFLSMIRERLVLMKDLLSQDGSIYVHVSAQVDPYIRPLLDETFGRENYRNSIRWRRMSISGFKGKQKIPFNHETIYLYTRSGSFTFNPKTSEYSDEYKSRFRYRDADGRLFRADQNLGTATSAERIIQMIEQGLVHKGENGKLYRKQYLDELPGVYLDDIWTDIPWVTAGNQRINYPTQKPEALIERIVELSSNEGDLVGDFFCGSGTTAAVAEKLGRKWIVADLGKFAIHTTRKRMIGVQRQLKEEGKDFRSFEILNLGRYERSHYIGVNLSFREEERQVQFHQKEADFLALILKAYQAEPVTGFGCFQGQRLGRLVAIGSIDLPISRSFIEEVIKECLKRNVKKVDLLGFEFETGVFPKVLDYASSNGIEIVPKYIPSEVLDKRAVDKGQVVFHNVAYAEAEPSVSNGTLSVKLTGFKVIHSLDSDAYECTALGSGKRSLKRTVMENGKVVKISKGNGGETEREVLTKHWSDWVDYWSVDFNYKTDEGNQVFKSGWQSFRTRRDRSLELTAVTQEVTFGPRKIAIQVVDIFGNSTMAIIDIVI